MSLENVAPDGLYLTFYPPTTRSILGCGPVAVRYVL